MEKNFQPTLDPTTLYDLQPGEELYTTADILTIHRKKSENGPGTPQNSTGVVARMRLTEKYSSIRVVPQRNLFTGEVVNNSHQIIVIRTSSQPR